MSRAPVVNDLLNLLHRCKDGVRALAPKGAVQIRRDDAFVLSLFWRTVRLFDGIIVLLEKDLPEEAMLLARSLFNDALRLAELKDAGRERPALLLGWANSSIEEKKNLMKEAARLGLEQNPDSLIKELNEQQRELQGYCTRRGVGKLRRFLSERAAAEKFGRAEDYWTYIFAHEFVHGSDAAFTFSRVKDTSDNVVVRDRTVDAQIIVGAGCFAAISLLQAAKSTVDMFGWEGGQTLEPLSTEIRRLAGNSRAGG